MLQVTLTDIGPNKSRKGNQKNKKKREEQNDIKPKPMYTLFSRAHE